MDSNKNIYLKVLGLELLLIIFFTANGAFVSIMMPANPALQYIGILPLVIGILIYLGITKKWTHYFSVKSLIKKETMILSSPLLLVLLIVLIGHHGLSSTSVSNLVQIFIMQICVIAFTEEIIFRGFMLRILLSKGFKVAVIISSILFALTHSLQLLGGQSLEQTFIQITYAFVVGMVLSLFVIHTQSIIIPVIFHGLNNSFQMTARYDGAAVYSYVIIAILIVYMVFLWKQANKLTITKN